MLLLFAFVAVPVMAHEDADIENHIPAEPNAVDDVGTAHALVQSITLDTTNLTRGNIITATVTYAPADDTTRDAVEGVAGPPEVEAVPGLHATLDPTSITTSSFELQTKATAEDGTVTFTTVSANVPDVTTVAQVTLPSTGVGAVYRVFISAPTTANDGEYYLSTTNEVGTGLITDAQKQMLTMDTRTPTVTNIEVRAIGQNYANVDGEWSDPFEITFDLLDPVYDPESTGPTAIDPDLENNFASSLDLNSITFDVDSSDELTFSSVSFIGPNQRMGPNQSNKYVVTATPVVGTANKAAASVEVTIKVSDMAGNEGRSTDRTDPENAATSRDPLTVKLAARAGTGTGTGPGDTIAPTLMSITAPTEPEADDSLVFTIVFSEALAPGTFDEDADLEISNAVSSDLDTTDNITYTLTIVPANKDFPVKVEFKSGAMVDDASTNANSSAALTGTDTYTPEGVLGVDITPPMKAEIDGRLKFKFEFALIPDTTEGAAGAFTVSDITVTNAEALVAANLQQSVQDSKVFTLTVTPVDPSLPVTVQLNGDAVSGVDNKGTPDNMDDDETLIAGQIDVTYTPDVTAPVATITAPTAAGSGNSLTFTIDFDEALSTALTVANLAITGADVSTATLTAGTAPAGAASRYILVVTGTPGTAVTVNIMANAVMDDMNNYVAPLATAATFTIPIDEGDTTAPTLAISYSPENGVALPASGNVTFTFAFNEALGTGINAFTLGDVTITNGTPIDFSGSGTSYTLEVKPVDPNMPVGVAVTGTVQDAAGNALATGSEASYEPVDDTDPTVVITGAAGTGNDVGKIVFTFTFSEELGSGAYAFTIADIDRTNSNVLLSGQPVQDASDPTVYTLVVEPNPSDADPVIIVLRTLSVADATGNTLKGDQVGTYRKPPPPTPETDKPVVTISGPSYIDSVSGNTVTIAATDNVGVTNAVMDAEVSVTNGRKGTLTSGEIHVIPNVAATTVTVSVAAGAAMDAEGNGSAAVSMEFNVGPIFTVPAGSGNANPGYLVITKSAGATHQYLSDQPTIHTSPQDQNPPIPAPDIEIGVWDNMPDLERLFNTASGNGGTLNIKAAATNGDAGTANVRMTEVMWGIDESMRGALNDAEAADQWVEVENPNTHEVKIIIYARTGLDSAINTNDGQIDRMGNAYHKDPGNARWTVPGNNGNSYTGTDFVSMWRRYAGDDRGKGYQNGTSSGAWHISGKDKEDKDVDNVYLTSATRNPNDDKLYNHIGTPGRLQSVTLPRPSTRSGVTQVPSSPVIINEVANRDSGNSEYEWIELRNVTGADVNLRNWMISMVTATGTDRPLVQFPANNNAMILANGVLLLLASNPLDDDDHPIAVGYNVDVNENDQVEGLGLIVEGSNRQPPRQKVITFENGGLPNSGDFILILRRKDSDHNNRSGAHGGQGVAETGEADVDKIVDIAGHHRELNKSNYPGTTPVGLNSTTLWPLVNFNGDMRPQERGGNRNNKLSVNKVRYRQHAVTKAKNDANDPTPGNRAGTGVTHKDEGVGHYAFRDAVYTGLGYRRTARVAGYNNGTPGYDGNSVGNTGIVKATAADAKVTISEIMPSTGPNPENPVYPQWIELFNSSPTDAVNLRNWKLRFETLDADGNPMDNLMDLNFNSSRSVKTILPQQTVLIVASRAQANSDARTGTDVFNENRVFNIQRDIGLGKFGANTDHMFFNPTAFSIELLDKDNKVVDRIGNLDGDFRTSDTNAWDFPVGVAADGNRTSFIRVYGDGVARDAHNLTESNVMPIGERPGSDGIDEKYAWIPAVNADLQHKISIRSTWYGNEDDYGTPNNRKGIVLPVQLSFFRPTLEDGVVTVRWTTESELDNAGFNIYRSETRDGEYKQVNTELIDGAGTTGERTNYSWVDQTAKPGVVYYYQIEDVSFAGDREALAVTKLKGLISAKNKLTTTWSELKEASQ